MYCKHCKHTQEDASACEIEGHVNTWASNNKQVATPRQHHLPSARMRSEGYSSCPVCVCVCVCLSVCYHYSGTTGYEAAKEGYQRPERYVGIVFKKAIFLKLLRSRVMA